MKSVRDQVDEKLSDCLLRFGNAVKYFHMSKRAFQMFEDEIKPAYTTGGKTSVVYRGTDFEIDTSLNENEIRIYMNESVYLSDTLDLEEAFGKSIQNIVNPPCWHTWKIDFIGEVGHEYKSCSKCGVKFEDA